MRKPVNYYEITCYYDSVNKVIYNQLENILKTIFWDIVFQKMYSKI